MLQAKLVLKNALAQIGMVANAMKLVGTLFLIGTLEMVHMMVS